MMRLSNILLLVASVGFGLALAQEVPAPSKPSAQPPTASEKSNTFSDIVDKTIEREHRFLDVVRYFKPVAESYIQNLKKDPELGVVPKDDEYFLGRMDLSGASPADSSFLQEQHDWMHRFGRSNLSEKGMPLGFAQAIFPDHSHFDRQHYTFKFVRWEMLGEVRCVVLDVFPRPGAGGTGFLGRMWVEDQGFNIVRFTGTYTARRSFHFDSWRFNVIPTLWVPALVYTEESDLHESKNQGPWFKAQTRLWGYDLEHAGDHKEYAKPLTDMPLAVGDKRNEPSQDLSPNLSVQRPLYSAEENVVERLQVAGLMAPTGPVDQVLEQVITNLLITNDLDIAGIRCHVLLTSPLESFVVGRTIIVSRGLLDVLPDEGTLAAVLAHDLAHIVLKHSVGSEYGSASQLMFPDAETFQRFKFRFDPAQEAAADQKALELLAKSPYKDKLQNAGLFLQALAARAPQLPNLVTPHLTNEFAGDRLVHMQSLAKAAPKLDMASTDQIAALPLGGRIKLDPWSDRLEFAKSKPVRPFYSGEKMMFEVTPFYPYLRRVSSPQTPVVSKNGTSQ